MQHRRWGGGRQGHRNRRERDRYIRIGKDEEGDNEMTRRIRDDLTEIWRIRHNVTRNPKGTVPNAPLASAPGNEFHPPILISLALHGGKVQKEIRLTGANNPGGSKYLIFGSSHRTISYMERWCVFYYLYCIAETQTVRICTNCF